MPLVSAGKRRVRLHVPWQGKAPEQGEVLSFARAGVPSHAPPAVVERHDQSAEERELDLGRVRVGEGSGAGAGLDPR